MTRGSHTNPTATYGPLSPSSLQWALILPLSDWGHSTTPSLSSVLSPFYRWGNWVKGIKCWPTKHTESDYSSSALTSRNTRYYDCRLSSRGFGGPISAPDSPVCATNDISQRATPSQPPDGGRGLLPCPSVRLVNKSEQIN